MEKPQPGPPVSAAIPQGLAVWPADDTFCPQRQRKFVLVSAILASSLGFIDGSVVAIAIPAIRADLDAGLTAMQWVSNSYMLFLGALVLAGGAAGDRYGLRNVFMTGIALFILASVLCAMAPDAAFLIAARSLQGVGAAIMVPGSLAIIAKAYPAGERGRAIGIWAAASAVTTAMGPLAGGIWLALAGDLGLSGGWRAIFAINIPLGLIAIGLLASRVPTDPADATRRPDITGAVLATFALGLTAYGLTGGGVEGQPGQTNWPMVGAGLLLLATFLIWQTRAADPMMPLRLYASRNFSAANAMTLSLYFSLSAILFFLPMTLVSGWRLEESQTALVFLPLTILIGALSGQIGKLAPIWGVRVLLTAGSAVCAMAYAAMALTMHLNAFWTILLPLMAVMGLGMALVVSPLSVAVMAAAGDRETGIASAINNTAARLAGLLAVAILGGVATAAFDASFVASGQMQPGAGFGELPDMPANDGLRLAFSSAMNDAFAAIAWVAAAGAALSAVISWFALEDQRRLDGAPD